jgi:hypothetical protein
MGGDDFAAAGLGTAEVGAEAGSPGFFSGKIAGSRQGEKNFITDKTQEAFAGGGRHAGLG